MSFKITHASKGVAIRSLSILAARLIIWGLVTSYWFIPAIITEPSNGWIVFWYFIANLLILKLELKFRGNEKNRTYGL